MIYHHVKYESLDTEGRLMLIECWEKVEDDKVVGFVDKDGNDLGLPAVGARWQMVSRREFDAPGQIDE